MSAAEYQLGRRGAGARGTADQEYRAARWRLIVAALWLAGLVAWGIVSYATTDPAAGPETGTSAQDEAPLDGRGKWTGY